MKDKRVLEDICADANNNPDFLKEVLMHTGMEERTLMQIYMIYKFKWCVGVYEKCNPTWDNICMAWVNKDFAKMFADTYKPGMTVRQCWDKLRPEIDKVYPPK
jgi:hypothetical protein